jgi:hypothetical protein
MDEAEHTALSIDVPSCNSGVSPRTNPDIAASHGPSALFTSLPNGDRDQPSIAMVGDQPTDVDEQGELQ